MCHLVRPPANLAELDTSELSPCSWTAGGDGGGTRCRRKLCWPPPLSLTSLFPAGVASAPGIWQHLGTGLEIALLLAAGGCRPGMLPNVPPTGQPQGQLFTHVSAVLRTVAPGCHCPCVLSLSRGLSLSPPACEHRSRQLPGAAAQVSSELLGLSPCWEHSLCVIISVFWFFL